jgi:hypothetical protein
MDAVTMLNALYTAAAQAGLLTAAVVNGEFIMVDFRAPDDDVLDGLGVSRGYTIRYPSNRLALAAGDELVIAGATYRVREVTRLGDGSECRASLTLRF